MRIIKTASVIKPLFLLILVVSALPIKAQTDSTRTFYRATTIGIGAVNILDTYLSPEEYTGLEVRFRSDIMGFNRKSDGRSSHHSIIMGNYSSTDHNGDGNMMAGMFTFDYGLHYNWYLLGGRLHLQAGGIIDSNLGLIYNTRNSNNPAQAKASINIMPSASAGYDFRLFRHQATVNMQLDLPLAGVMFSPNYGQSYYEIFSQGNYDHNIVPTTFVSAPSMRSYLTLDYSLRTCSLRIGYMGDFQQAKVNSLKSHSWSHIFMIGFVKRFKLMRIR